MLTTAFILAVITAPVIPISVPLMAAAVAVVLPSAIL